MKPCYRLFLKLFLSSVIYFSNFTSPSCGEKILLFPFQIESHILTLNAIGTELVAEGHEVYTVVHSKIVKKFDKLYSKGLKPLVYKVPEEMTTIASVEYQSMWINDILKGKLQRFYDSMSYQVNKQCDHMELDEGFLGSLTAHKFDLAVMDGVDFALRNYLFVSALDIPYVTVTSFEDSDFARLPSLPSFVPSTFMLTAGKMDFKERLISFFHFFFPSTTKQLTPSKYYNFTLFQSYHYILDPDVKSFSDLPMKAMMTFITRGYMLETPSPHLPTVHSLECITASDVSEPPKGFDKVLKDANHGTVLVSFGTLISHLPDPTMQILLDAFRQRKELFLIKYFSNTPGNLNVPPNVNFFEWLPQNELLGQPGTQLLINHGGNLGQYEALYNGVPTLNMPLFADQHHNAFRMEHRGYGLTLDWKELDSDKLIHTLNTLLDDSSFKERTRKAAYLIRSRPQDSRQTAAYWIEHLLQFGDDHLQSVSIDLSWSQYWMLDILIFLLSLVMALLVASGFLVRWLIRPLRQKIEKPKQKKQ